MSMDARSAGVSDLSRAYLASFSAGDFHVYMHGRKVRIEASTTHPAQIELVSSVFERHAHRIMYPIRTPHGFGWRMVYDVGKEFVFLLDSRSLTYEALGKSRTFYFAISGLIDSEGHIGVTSDSEYPTPIIIISNSDLYLICLVLRLLEQRGYRASIQTKTFKDGTKCHELRLGGRSAIRLLKRVHIHHREKREALEIILANQNDLPRARWEYLKLRKRIREERDACAESAKIAFQNRGERKLQKRFAYEEISKSAKSMHEQGLRISKIAIALGKSERTIYRYLGRRLDGEGTSPEAQ